MDEKPKTLREQQVAAMNIACVAARCLAAPVEPPLNSAPGSERYGIFHVVAFGGMILASGHYHDVRLLQYAWVWVGMTLFRRIQTFINWRRGIVTHSRYPGDAWLANMLGMRRLGFLGNVVLCGLIGFLLMGVSVHLGKMWWIGGASIAFLGITETVLDAARRRSIIDGQIEMEFMRR
jgi:hypothetical protein